MCIRDSTQSLHNNAGSYTRRLDEHCYLKFFLVGASTLNRLGHFHVVAHYRYPGRITYYVKNYVQTLYLLDWIVGCVLEGRLKVPDPRYP